MHILHKCGGLPSVIRAALGAGGVEETFWRFLREDNFISEENGGTPRAHGRSCAHPPAMPSSSNPTDGTVNRLFPHAHTARLITAASAPPFFFATSTTAVLGRGGREDSHKKPLLPPPKALSLANWMCLRSKWELMLLWMLL